LIQEDLLLATVLLRLIVFWSYFVALEIIWKNKDKETYNICIDDNFGENLIEEQIIEMIKEK